jgi:TonB-linked SusC/RagA family outer membrane protein
MIKKLINGKMIPQFPKILLVMRISIFLIVLSTTLSFGNSYAQLTRLSLNMEQVTVQEVLEKVESQSEFIFFYMDQQFDLERKVDINLTDKSIEEVLDCVLKGTSNTYRIRDRQVIIGKNKKDFSKKNVPLKKADKEFGSPDDQKKKVTGNVTDDKGETIPGVTVIVKGTAQGTITDMDGNFTIEVPNGKSVLQFRFIGMKEEEVAINNQTTINVSLYQSIGQIDEVVITALGISQKKKTLGYATQQIKSEQFEKNQSANVMTSLAGMVAGLQVNTASTVGGSTRITLRGESSLSREGNSPLIVVDGVPIANNDGSIHDGTGGDMVDFGGGLNDISPNDIESINVLKGPAAAALYGSRAGNGAIIITTKSASGSELKISVNSSVTVEEMLKYPTGYQYKYGPGVLDSYYHLYNKDDLTFNLEAFDETWSSVPYNPDFLVEMWYSPTWNGYRAGDTEVVDKGPIEKVPYVNNGKNNYEQFYEKGLTQNHNIALDLPGKVVNTRVSFSYMDQKGIMPGSGSDRYNMSFNTGGQLTDKFLLKVHVNLAHSGAENIPQTGNNNRSIPYLLAWTPPGTEFEHLKEYWQRGVPGEQFVWRSQHNNPYYVAHELKSIYSREKAVMSMAGTYSITNNLNLTLRYAMDYNSGNTESFRPVGMKRWSPSYNTNYSKGTETNADALISYNKDFNENFSLQVNAGGNFMKYQHKNTKAGGILTMPDYNNLALAAIKTNGQGGAEKQINSLYASANLGFKQGLFLNLTARNDWSSTLPVENNSYFYPSAGLSLLMHEFVQMPAAVPFLKLRAAVAQVGKDTGPYRLSNTISQGVNNSGASIPGTIANSNLRPEKTTSYEMGANSYLFNIAKIDFTYYYISTIDQVVDLTIPISSGFDRRRLNAGEVENQGIEVSLESGFVDTDNFKWEWRLNYSRNRNKLVSIAEGLDRYPIADFGRNTSVVAGVGQPVFGIYGYKHATVQDESSPHYMRKLYSAGGAPVVGTEPEYLGNANPDWQLGYGNRLKYKNLAFEFMFDMRYGGKIFSGISQTMYSGGHTQETVVLREEGIVGDGVVQQEDGTYRENIKGLQGVEIFTTWKTPYTNISENFLYDGSYIKLRGVNLSYELPKGALSFLKIRSANISLIGRNLWVWSKVPNQDPDVYSNGVPGNAGTYYFPTTRSYGVNLNLKF